jgi:hypothetical protein
MVFAFPGIGQQHLELAHGRVLHSLVHHPAALLEIKTFYAHLIAAIKHALLFCILDVVLQMLL